MIKKVLGMAAIIGAAAYAGYKLKERENEIGYQDGYEDGYMNGCDDASEFNGNPLYDDCCDCDICEECDGCTAHDDVSEPTGSPTSDDWPEDRTAEEVNETSDHDTSTNVKKATAKKKRKIPTGE